MSFYNRHIHPSSPHRSVLSVHVKSQIEHQPPDFAQQLAENVRLFIANEGYDIPPPEVADAVKGDPSLIPQSLYAVIVKHGYNKERVAGSMAKGAEILNAQIAMNGVANGESAAKPQVLKEVKVKDIHKFRGTLKMGRNLHLFSRWRHIMRVIRRGFNRGPREQHYQ